MRLKVNHTTTYHYDVPASYALQQLRVRPQPNACQTILSWDMQLDGAQHHTSFRDQHGNHVDLIELDPGVPDIKITVSGEVETHNTNGVLGRHMQMMPLWFYLRQTDLTAPGDGIHDLVKSIEAKALLDIERLHALSEAIKDNVAYTIGSTDVKTTGEQALKSGQGVCQDHTHVFISAARLLGFPARYVSGYLMMNDRIEQDASHAWAEAHVEGLGWVGFDISNAISPDERYVQIARGL
ncbi:MAG: transglutaminase family protein, partial [Pseudomonadota bacterium]